MGKNYYIGWDVGAWHCDKNKSSRDAIVILTQSPSLKIVGTPWRGNLREKINDAATTTDWLRSLFELCEAKGEYDSDTSRVYLAIDAPLGFPCGFVELVSSLSGMCEVSDDWKQNPYLFRQTERVLWERKRPLSAVQDMIGSQSTKGMHMLAKFAPTNPRTGVWTKESLLTALETYPGACQKSKRIRALHKQYGSEWKHKKSDKGKDKDKKDALTCALVAYLYAEEKECLAEPRSIPKSEGWIWVPKDVL